VTVAGGAVRAVEALGTSSLPCPQQLELMRAPDGTLPVSAIALGRKAGRPKGARNKRSKKIAEYYVQRYGDPIDAIGQLANTPLRQLIEVIMEADGSTEREAKLLEGVEEAIECIRSLSKRNWSGDVNTSRELAEDLSDAIEKLARAAQAISGKPGKLALDALALQMQAHVKALEYVHGKQPISVDIAGRIDAVIFAPELLKQHGIDPVELESAVNKGGLAAFDEDRLQIVDATDAEFEPVDGPDDETDETGGAND
jgi:hypothetical protein